MGSKFHLFSAALALALTTCFARAQSLSSPGAPGDSVVAAVAEAMGLLIIAEEDRPCCGTFWIISADFPQITAPLPCPPLDSSLPVYALTGPLLGGQFLVDDTKGQVISPERLQRLPTGTTLSAVAAAQAVALQEFVSGIQEHQALREAAATMSTAGVPMPGEGGYGQ